MGIHCSVLHFGIAKLVYLPKQFVKISRTDGGYKYTRILGCLKIAPQNHPRFFTGNQWWQRVPQFSRSYLHNKMIWCVLKIGYPQIVVVYHNLPNKTCYSHLGGIHNFQTPQNHKVDRYHIIPVYPRNGTVFANYKTLINV
jgi:hypothetical protein